MAEGNDSLEIDLNVSCIQKVNGPNLLKIFILKCLRWFRRGLCLWDIHNPVWELHPRVAQTERRNSSTGLWIWWSHSNIYLQEGQLRQVVRWGNLPLSKHSHHNSNTRPRWWHGNFMEFILKYFIYRWAANSKGAMQAIIHWLEIHQGLKQIITSKDSCVRFRGFDECSKRLMAILTSNWPSLWFVYNCVGVIVLLFYSNHDIIKIYSIYRSLNRKPSWNNWNFWLKTQQIMESVTLPPYQMSLPQSA